MEFSDSNIFKEVVKTYHKFNICTGRRVDGFKEMFHVIKAPEVEILNVYYLLLKNNSISE
jgi:hypothetical protein